MTEGAIHFISDLVTYKPKSIIIRTLIVSLIALLCLLMTDRITAINLIEMKKPNIMFFIGVIFITEINILLNYLITKLGNDTVMVESAVRCETLAVDEMLHLLLGILYVKFTVLLLVFSE